MSAKKIILLGTGGTIAGTVPDTVEQQRYLPATLAIQQLLVDLPTFAQLAPIEAEQVFQLGSEDLTPTHWLTLAQRTQPHLDDKNVAGIVITHGTDTLEETAYFLHLVLKTTKPVVLVGAMRPANAPDADGPTNLAQALQVARHPGAVGQGVLVVMQGKIWSARDVTKRHTSRLNAFENYRRDDARVLGTVVDETVQWVTKPQHLQPLDSPFSIQRWGEAVLPGVEIIYGYAGASCVAIEAWVNAGVSGIVVAAVGDGSLSATMRAALQEANRRGVVVVRASRTGAGLVRHGTHVLEDEQMFVSANTLNPQKARVLLMLALSLPAVIALQGMQRIREIQRLFDTD